MRRPRERVADAVGFYPRVRAMAGIDTIWPYQFGVYVGINAWAIWTLYSLIHLHTKPDSTIFFIPDGDIYLVWIWSFVVSPPITFIGYLIPRKDVGVILSFAGNSSLAWSMWTYSATLLLTPKHATLSTTITALIAGCITLRAIRDVFVIRKFRSESKISKLGRHSRKRQEAKRL